MPRASAWIGFTTFTRAFGLTEPTGIDLPGEGKGQFHKLDVASDWNEVALATASFGQRFTVTPIQMLNMVCAIVDDGKLKKPYVVKEVLSGDGSVKSTNETEVVRQVISEDTSAYMRGAMEQVVANGTGKNAYVPGYRVGGKTATSEIQPEYDSDGKVLDTEDRYTASFIGRSADGRPADRGSGLHQRPAGVRNAYRRYDRRSGCRPHHGGCAAVYRHYAGLRRQRE